MRMQTFYALVVGGLALCLVGCGFTSTHSITAPEGTTTAPVELKTVTAAEWDKVLQDQRGKVVVVDVWASWCVACMKKYPDFLALRTRYGKDDLACLSLTVDTDEDVAAASKFLTRVNSTVPNYRYADKMEWQEQFKLKGLPVCYVYGRDGKLVQKFDVNEKEFTYADVEAVVKTEIARK